MKILKLFRDFCAENKTKIVFVTSALFFLLLGALAFPAPSIIKNILIYLLAIFVIGSIYFFIIKSSYDFRKKKLKVIDFWSVFIWSIMLIVMSIGGGIIGWVFLVTAILIIVIQSTLRIMIRIRK